ncbi:MAG: molecular chaperone DnaJ [Vulcanimicrobiota bacterium]
MSRRDYYEILGVSRDADTKDIKRAFKRLARQYHPDVAENKAEAEQKFGEINEAYSVLVDDEKRRYYDQTGRAPGVNSPGGAGFEDFGFGGFGGFGDILDSIFGMGGGGGGRRRGPSRGANLRMNLTITLEEAYQGVSKDIELTSDVRCETCDGKRTTDPNGFRNCRQCHGTGQIHQVVRTPFGQLTQVAPCAACRGEGRELVKPCSACEGRGVTARKRTLKVKIPAGIDTGKMIPIPGEGAPGAMGGPPGDLYLAIEVAAHKEFERRADDLIRRVKLTFTDAALGGTVEVPMLVGESKQLKIQPGTQNGTILRIRGAGMPRLERSSHGDLHVIIEVMVPTKLNSKQKKLLKEFAEAGSQEAEPSFFNRLKDAIFG